MQFRMNFQKILAVVTLFLASAVSAFGGDVTNSVTPPETPVYDFLVTVTTKDSTHPHFGEGGQLGFVINDVQGRTLVLARGKVYKFKIETSPMHDFYLATDPMGWGTAPLLSGVTGNFTYKGVLTSKPTAE